MPVGCYAVSVFVCGLEVISGIKKKHRNIRCDGADEMKHNHVFRLKAAGYTGVRAKNVKLLAHKRG